MSVLQQLLLLIFQQSTVMNKFLKWYLESSSLTDLEDQVICEENSLPAVQVIVSN